MKIIAAKVEEILEFSKESEADDFCNMMKKVDKNFELLDYDNYDRNKYRIRIVRSHGNCKMLVSSWSIDNDPEI